MSIRFPDLQVLLPRANSTSQIQQQNQRQVDVSQAQLAAETVAEIETKRRQITKSQAAEQERIRERGKRRRQDLAQPDMDKEPRTMGTSEQHRQDGVQGELGQSIDIRI